MTGILPAYLNVLTGHTVYIATVNDYLAKRDRDYFDIVFKLLAIEVCATAAVPACAVLVVEVLTCAAVLLRCMLVRGTKLCLVYDNAHTAPRCPLVAWQPE